ncbi:MAG: hypothetical protein BRD31_02180 [Bacteroidetes bacterium QH_2_64_26]|nr:MAG: hypothetical protein BRD31_02180 [Bacteroidetes bacterium QH_2_64_26]
MPTTRSSSGPEIPRILLPMVRLLQWSHESLESVPGPSGRRQGALDAGGALLLVGAIAVAAMVGLPPLLTIGGGIGVAVLFVVARTWVAVQEHDPA